jgi:carbamoyltransferase
MRDRINLEIKGRESFRPLAPAVLWENASEWFQIEQESPYMLMAVPVRPEMRDIIPAVTHVDGSARIQTVGRLDNALFYDLLARFKSLSGVPVLLNTSLNVKGRPIANSAADLMWCIKNTSLDCLVASDLLLRRSVDD